MNHSVRWILFLFGLLLLVSLLDQSTGPALAGESAVSHGIEISLDDNCPNPRPRRDLYLIGWVHESEESDHAWATVWNRSTACWYSINMAAYQVLDGSVATQELFSTYISDPGILIGPGQELRLEVPLPSCQAQVDVFYGPIIQSFVNGDRYDRRRLDSIHTDREYCQTRNFVDQLAEATWSYLSSDWATDNNLPWSWRAVGEVGGDYANPTEIGLYMLSILGAYEMARPWSPTWPEVETEVTATLNQLEAWQSGSQPYQPHGPNAYTHSAFYQWYWINGDSPNSPPVVGGGDGDRAVPSVDNAWLAASLITIREYAERHGHPILADRANAILSRMDFTLWYNEEQHLFNHGSVDDPLGSGTWWDFLSNEGRIINFVARAMGDLSSEEYQNSLDALTQDAGTYDRGTPDTSDDITLGSVAYDGSYFVFNAPGLFIRQNELPYGAGTVDPATAAQIAYAQDRDYVVWGLSDVYDVGMGNYIEQGAFPVAVINFGPPETHPGVVTPHASALALNTSFHHQAVANLENLADLFPGFYDAAYGFRDGVMANPNDPQFGEFSARFTALAQEWLFLSIVNSETGFIWEHFYLDEGVRNAHYEMRDSLTSGTSQSLPAAPVGQNLVVNSSLTGLNGWHETARSDGTLQLWQQLPFVAPVNAPFEVLLDLGNSEMVAQTVSVILYNNSNMGDHIQCMFTIPASTSLHGTYVVRGRTNLVWAGIRLEIDARPGVVVNNVSVEYQPFAAYTVDQCVSTMM